MITPLVSLYVDWALPTFHKLALFDKFLSVALASVLLLKTLSAISNLAFIANSHPLATTSINKSILAVRSRA